MISEWRERRRERDRLRTIEAWRYDYDGDLDAVIDAAEHISELWAAVSEAADRVARKGTRNDSNAAQRVKSVMDERRRYWSDFLYAAEFQRTAEEMAEKRKAKK